MNIFNIVTRVIALVLLGIITIVFINLNKLVTNMVEILGALLNALGGSWTEVEFSLRRYF